MIAGANGRDGHWTGHFSGERRSGICKRVVQFIIVLPGNPADQGYTVRLEKREWTGIRRGSKHLQKTLVGETSGPGKEGFRPTGSGEDSAD